MKVKIVKPKNCWYRDKVGEIYEVELNSCQQYRIKEGRYKGFCIDEEHAEIISDTIKIPFTFSAWDKDRSQKVWTRDGREVTQLTWFDCNSIVPLVGVVENDVMRWGVNGLWGSSVSKFDLFLEHTEKEYFVNVYESSKIGVSVSPIVFKTFEEAEKMGTGYHTYIKTISFKA